MVYDDNGMQRFLVPVTITHDISYLEYRNICIELEASPLHRVEVGFEFSKNRNIRFALYSTHPTYNDNWREQSELQSNETFISKGRYELDIRSYNHELWNEENIRNIYQVFYKYGWLIRDPSTYDYRTDADKDWNENDEHTVPDSLNRFDYYVGKHVHVEIEDDFSSPLKIDRVLRKDQDGYYVQINRRKQRLANYWLDEAEFD